VEACGAVEELATVEGFTLLLDCKVVTVAVSTDEAMELGDVDSVETLVWVPAVVIDVCVSLTISVSINAMYQEILHSILKKERLVVWILE
jgi:hypothetical protein